MTYKSGYRYVTQDISYHALSFATLPFWMGSILEITNVAKTNEYRLRISRNYAWDGASFTLFKWFGTPDSWLTPSLVHDALYQAMREGFLQLTYRERVDRLFRSMLIERGVWRALAWAAYYAVRVFGNFAVRKTNPVREVV